jgi:hypothetical protein
MVLGRTNILHAVWDEACDGDVNRRRDLPFARSSVRTVRGAGDSFSSDGG